MTINELIREIHRIVPANRSVCVDVECWRFVSGKSPQVKFRSYVAAGAGGAAVSHEAMSPEALIELMRGEFPEVSDQDQSHDALHCELVAVGEEVFS